MNSYLMKNGEVLSDIIPSPDHPLPERPENCWHDCTVVAAKRIEARPTDRLDIVVNSRPRIPFLFSRCRVSPEGWEVIGQVLF
jgi:hypothetical protein